MYSLWNRLNAVFFYAVTALFALSVGSAITTVWMTPLAVVNSLHLNNITKFDFMREKLKNGRFLSVDRAVMTFDLDADLSGVFNWNVKQLFVYITASYETEKKIKNEVVLWDYIVRDQSEARLVFKNWDIDLTLHWDVMPLTGLLYFDTKGSAKVQLPHEYCPNGCDGVPAGQ